MRRLLSNPLLRRAFSTEVRFEVPPKPSPEKIKHALDMAENDIQQTIKASAPKHFRLKEPVHIYEPGAEDGPQGTKWWLKSVDQIVGEPEVYTSKYPEKSVQDVVDEYARVTNIELYHDEDIIDLAMTFGYSTRAEAKAIFELNKISVTKDTPEGKVLDWNAVLKHLSISKGMNSHLKTIQANLEELEQRVKFQESVAKSQTPPINWESIAQSYGEEDAFEIRSKYYESFDLAPAYDGNAVADRIFASLNPGIEKLKDFLIEQLPEVQQDIAWCEKRKVLFQKDEYGLPYDYQTYEYLEEFYPEVRDEIIMEIEEGNYEYKYKDEFRALPVSAMEDVFATNVKKEMAQFQKIDDIVNQRVQEKNVLNPRQSALQQLMKDVQEQHVKNKAIEQEISGLKTQLDNIVQAKAKAARAKGAKEGKGKKGQIDEKSDKIWKEWLKSQGIVVEETEQGPKVYQIQQDGSLVLHPQYNKRLNKPVDAPVEL